MSVTVIADERIGAARREHRCSLCTRKIRVGECYHRQRNVWDGTPYVWRSCAHCSAFTRLADLHDRAAGWHDDGLSADDIQDFEPETFAEARWLVQWRRQWTSRTQTLYPVPSDRNGDSNRG